MKYLQTLRCAWLLCFFMLHSSFCLPAQNTTFTYQGRVQDHGTNYTGAGLFQFVLLTTNATATNTWWSNDGTSVSGGEPSAAVTVAVTNGLFTVALGNPGMAALPAAVFLQPGLQLQLWFNDAVNGFHAFPVQPLTPAPYATYAATAGTAGGVTGLTVQTNADNAPDIIAGSSVNFVTGGVVGATISGGGGFDPYTGASYTNRVTDEFGTVGGGGNNSAGYLSTVGGGYGNNTMDEGSSTIAGGYENYIGGTFDSIGGGLLNTIAINNNSVPLNGDSSTIAGGDDNTIGTNAFASVIAGGDGNTIHFDSDHATIAGGQINEILDFCALATIGGGFSNNIATGSPEGTIGGGFGNLIQNSVQATIGGGFENLATGNSPTVSGGSNNKALDWATVGGGTGNYAGGANTTVSGGADNQATQTYATVPGGYENIAGGQSSFAAGQQAQALHQGAFVWADSQNATFTSTGNNQFLIRAAGGVGINTTSPALDLSVNGGVAVDQAALNAGTTANALLFGGNSGEGLGSVRASGFADRYGLNFYSNHSKRLTILNNGNVGIGTTNATQLLVVGSGGAYCNGATWVNGSDRNSKQNFDDISPREVLAKVAALPITEWQYKVESAGTKHIGPMAQDFHAAFGLNGADDRHISTVDEGGVALAAIQGLNQKLQEQMSEKDAEIAQLQAKASQVDALQKQLQALAAAVQALTAKN